MIEAFWLSLGELIRTEISAGQLLQRGVEVIAELLEADRGTIFLLDTGRDELVSIAAHLPELQEIRVPISQGVAGYVARTGQFVNVPFAETDSRFWPAMDQRTGYTTQSMLAGPIHKKNGELIGVVQLLNKRDGGIFTSTDEERFQALLGQVANLLERTTLGSDTTPPEERDHAMEVPLGDQINRIIGHGPAMREIFRSIRRVAATEATVLLLGESGTGKSLVARALHFNSPRRSEPFVHLDCTTLPEGLMENELFGHERGAFTGAHARKKGKVEAANGGTLFLDEIGDLPTPLQGKLLTLLQERTFHRVGGNTRLDADIRIVAATNRDLEQHVRQGKFREDLYYRLRVVQLKIPPLRERGREDLIRLIQHFVVEASRPHRVNKRELRSDALEMLLSYPWPGNVRELENCIESAVIFADREITPSTLPLPRPNSTQSLTSLDPALIEAQQSTAHLPSPFLDEPSLKTLEGRYLAYLLKVHDGNRSVCARILHIGRNTLIRKIKEHQLD